jgi:hypothetical protein
MSIFTSAEDRRLPLQTQIAQVQNGEENAFIQHWMNRSGNTDPMLVQDTLPLSDQNILAFQELRDLIAAIMGQLADYKKIHRRELLLLGRLERKHQGATFYLGDFDADGYAAPDTIQPLTFPSSWFDAFFATTLEELFHLMKTPDRFARCEECGNPYYIVRDTGENRFCSNRCSARQRKRRERTLNVTAKNVLINVGPY